MKNVFWGLVLAFQFMTRIPVPLAAPWNTQTMRWALRHFALVGMVIGAVLSVSMNLLPVWPLWMTGLMILTLWIGLSGGLHLDGWMDVADAIGSNAPLEKKWLIMKDPHVGSFGIIALLLLLSWKVGLLISILELSTIPHGIWFLIPALARYGVLPLLWRFPLYKDTGLAFEWKKGLSFGGLIIGFLPLLVLLYFISLVDFIFLLSSYYLFLLSFAIWIKNKLKGLNGDVLGAAIEGGECWLLLVTFIWFGMV